jgi:hypothetical protein
MSDSIPSRLTSVLSAYRRLKLGSPAKLAQHQCALMRLRTAAVCAVSCNEPKPGSS